MNTVNDVDHPFCAKVSLLEGLVDESHGVKPNMRIESPVREAPSAPPNNIAMGAISSATSAVLADSGEHTTACIYDEACKKGYAVFTDVSGALSYSVFDNQKPSSGWSAPQQIKLGRKLRSTPRFVHAAGSGPILLACSDNGVQLIFFGSDLHPTITEGFIEYPKDPKVVSLPIQGFDATNKNSGGMGQFALIDSAGRLLLNSFTYDAKNATYSSGEWSDWGTGWTGKPALFFSSTTCWVAAHYTGRGSSYISYCWAYLASPRNYGAWWHFAYLPSNNPKGSPSFAKNYNLLNQKENYLLSVFVPTTGTTLAYSKTNSPDGYPYSDLTEVEVGYNIASEIKFVDTFSSNHAPMFFKTEDGKLLMSDYINKESQVSSSFRVLSENVRFFSFVGIPRKDIGRGFVQIFGFIKLFSGEDRTIECGEYMYPIV